LASDGDDLHSSIQQGSESLGIRILTIDGGSIRGLAVVEALRRLEAAGGRPIADMFDLIVGTSVGGFLATMIGVRRRTMDECAEALWGMRVSMFRAQGDGMLSGAKRIALGTAFDSDVHAESIQDTLGTEARMDEAAGSPKVAMVATCIDKSPAKPLLLRTYRLDEDARRRSAFEGTCNVTQLDAVKATTAAPTFFPPTTVDGRLCVDGACIANNPAVIALAEAATLWPRSHVEALVSVGTGLQSEAMHPGTSLVDWLTFQVNASMDCHLAHAITASMLGRGHYFRINFPGVGDVALNETRIEVIEEMVAKAAKHLETDEAKELIREAAAVLTSKPASGIMI
jgi:predicted acylesterase/phospholipase RssA